MEPLNGSTTKKATDLSNQTMETVMYLYTSVKSTRQHLAVFLSKMVRKSLLKSVKDKKVLKPRT